MERVFGRDRLGRERWGERKKGRYGGKMRVREIYI